jgi:hypothetical protein
MLPELEAARIDKVLRGNKLRSNMCKLTTQRECLVEVYVISEWEALYTEQLTERLASWQLFDSGKFLAVYVSGDRRPKRAHRTSLIGL